MFFKLLAIIISAGLAGAALLAMRQERIDTAYRISVVHADIVRKERMLWSLRAEIAERCTPARLRAMIEHMPEQWRAMPDPDAVRSGDAAQFPPLIEGHAEADGSRSDRSASTNRNQGQVGG